MSTLICFVASLAKAGAPPSSPIVAVEVIDGGLERAAIILQARFGTPIHYEGAPRNIEGVHFVRKSRMPGSDLDPGIVRSGDGGFVFRYPSNATPRQALEAAMAAYNTLPEGYVRYTVRDTGGSFDLVPAEVWDGTAWKASTPLLDTVITLPSATGPANDLLIAVTKALSEKSGMPVECNDGVGCPSLADPWHDPPIRIPSATGPARTLLNEIISRSDLANTWRLVWYQHSQEPGWLIQPNLVQPEDEEILNDTPLVPPSTPR